MDYQSWGRVVGAPHQVAYPRFAEDVAPLLQPDNDGQTVLPVGMRRSYGDSGLNPSARLIDMRGLDRLIAFDEDTGIGRFDAGVTLAQLNPLLVRKGWFVPTTPGTRFVTLGGAVANDIHGKNHHSAGSIGCSIRSLLLARSDTPPQRLTPGDPLFQATVGGLGLTGVILDVELQLTRIGSAFLDNERIAFGSVDDFFRVAEDSADFEHTVAWIDCAASGAKLGRGVFQRSNWRTDGDYRQVGRNSSPGIPIDFPGWALNRFSIKAFNSFYNWAQTRGPASSQVHYQPFFYPLDAIGGWNRMYGKRGFYQYQCVVPPDAAPAAMRQLLATISASGQGSFLAVLKTLGGKSSGGLLSFPMQGATLALDFANQGARTLHLLSQLDDIVREAGGRLYPAKDGRMPKRMFQAGYPRWQDMLKLKDPVMNSAFWERVSRQ